MAASSFTTSTLTSSTVPRAHPEHDIINILYNYIKDSNKMVVVAAINALNEIMQDEGGMAINGKIIIHLLGRITVLLDHSGFR